MEGNPVPLNIRLTLTLLFVASMPILALTPQITLPGRIRPDSKLAGSAPKNNQQLGADGQELGAISEELAAIDSVEQIQKTTATSVDGNDFESSKTARAEHAFRRLPPPDVSIQSARFDQIQERLQSLGVDYFVLERTDDVAAQHAAFRFHCRFQVPGSPIYLRPFEAHDADPLHAMERVLQEVEQWTARREAVGIWR